MKKVNNFSGNFLLLKKLIAIGIFGEYVFPLQEVENQCCARKISFLIKLKN